VNSNRRLLGNSRGFTLIEIMIVMAILAFISMGTYQATLETFKLRDSLSAESDFYNELRFSMNVVNRDVTLLYSPLIMKPPGPSPSPGVVANPPQPQLAQDSASESTFWSPPIDATGIRPSRFQGTDVKMSFISASHIRIYKDARETELAKISYELEKDAGNTDVPDAMVLVKHESPNVFEEDERKDTQTHIYPLLHGIKKLKYRYYNQDKDHWETTWDSDSQDQHNIYPDQIEITIEIGGPQKQSFSGVYKFKPEVPIRGIDPSS
jgi:general secretion pathway protein J